MNIASLSVKRPVTTVMLMLMIVVIGMVSFSKIGIDLFPNIEIPVAIVQTSYANVAPGEIEELITKPIEEAVGTIANIDTIQSITMEGTSIVVVQFDFGTDMDNAALKMREKVDLIKGYLPDDASNPMVLQIDPNAQAIMQISVSGADVVTLQDYADTELKPAFERIKGVASVDISGGYDNYIGIKVHTERLNGYGITIDTISQSIAAQNLNLPAGTVREGSSDLLVRVVGKFDSVDQIKQIPIMLSTGKTIHLEDVADIAISHKDFTTISKVNEEAAVSLAIQKQSGTNTVAVANEVRAAVNELNKNSDYKINIVVDNSNYIKDSISQVSKSAIIGGLLAILILFIFLRNIRSTIIISLSMPISIISTFVLIYFNNITLNMMTLGGLALGVGMLVDNSVVVLENIYRYRQDGYSKHDAAINGTKEVAMAVTASTLTTVAVFLPIAFVQGITAIMFKELALTVTFSLISSLVISLTLIPMLASKILKVDNFKEQHHVTKFRPLGKILDRSDKIYSKLDSGYRRLLKWSLGHRKTIVIVAVIIFFSSVISIAFIGKEFIPTTDEGQFSISVELESGAKTSDTSDAIDEIVSKIIELPEIDYIFSNTSSGNMLGSSQNEGQIEGILIPITERKRSVFEVIDDIENRIKDIPGVKTTISSQSSMMSMGGGSAISLEVKGDNLDELQKISDRLIQIVKDVGGTKNVTSSLTDAVPQLEIKLKPNAAQYGLTTYQVANSIKAIIDGKTATKYTYAGKDIDVILEGEDVYNSNINNLKQISLHTPTGAIVPVGAVADISMGVGPVVLNRADQARTITITADLNGRDIGAVSADIDAMLNTLSLPSGYTVEAGGQDELMTDAFKDLTMALGLAVLLVYMILASQFESLLLPFIIMFSAPVAFSGGLIGLFLTGRTLNMTSMIGFIMLAGIVVNNAIVLIDYINTRRKNGEERTEAVLSAGPIRLRPILMTTLTTVLGLLPMGLGIGSGAELQSSLSTVVIFGLSLSTLLTLVLIPVVYTIFDDMIIKTKSKKAIQE